MIVRNPVSQAEFSPSKMGKVSLCGGDHLYVGLNCFEPGQQHQAHVHTDQDKMYVVLQGRGEATVGEQVSLVEAGDVILARAGVSHAMRNPGPERLVVLVVFSPPPKS
ncbi:MAG: cupin domain-containing protein [Bryobacteraceae bacterium]|nr:cupin domain-containing protein [Bryobacteraceae bacterium]MDW8377834.1 cupin domain-containing protein [Bryobacterales bacterium]